MTTAALAAADPTLGQVIAAVEARIGPQQVKQSRASPFEALARAIVYQSLSEGAAATIFAHLRRAAGAPFDPTHIVAMSPGTLRAAGLSGVKVGAVRGLAEWFLANPVTAEALPSLPDGTIVQTLAGIRGVGAWTINVFLIFGLGRPDVMPANDLGIRRGVQLLVQPGDVCDSAAGRGARGGLAALSKPSVDLPLAGRETEASPRRPRPSVTGAAPAGAADRPDRRRNHSHSMVPGGFDVTS